LLDRDVIHVEDAVALEHVAERVDAPDFVAELAARAEPFAILTYSCIDGRGR
jgi:hypothetical protein